MLRQKLQNYDIILASGSPRRQQLFKVLDIPFSIQLKAVKEIYPDSLKESDITDYLAQLKAQSFTNLNDREILITADTIVWFDNKAIGKPKDYEDAFQMLKKLSDHMHEVYTSVCIKTSKNRKTINDCTKVYFTELSDDEIHDHLKNEQPFDKAGSYGIQDRIGLTGVYKIEGNYFNVMGLPVHKLYKELISFIKSSE
ncbi:MAG: septum formation protein Maf [Flavobacteriaceae bacterium]|nr:MAG: septum formation protein Maf [Flavobacteriaceae bacterium]